MAAIRFDLSTIEDEPMETANQLYNELFDALDGDDRPSALSESQFLDVLQLRLRGLQAAVDSHLEH